MFLRTTAFYLYAFAITAFAGFGFIVWDERFGTAVGVAGVASAAALAVRSTGRFSVVTTLVMSALGLGAGFFGGRAYFDSAVASDLPRYLEVVRANANGGNRLPLSGADADLAKNVRFPERDGAAAVFTLRNGEALEYVPDARRAAEWAEKPCRRELRPQWFVRGKCD